jgi:hypothetical protein
VRSSPFFFGTSSALPPRGADFAGFLEELKADIGNTFSYQDDRFFRHKSYSLTAFRNDRDPVVMKWMA